MSFEEELTSCRDKLANLENELSRLEMSVVRPLRVPDYHGPDELTSTDSVRKRNLEDIIDELESKRPKTKGAKQWRNWFENVYKNIHAIMEFQKRGAYNYFSAVLETATFEREYEDILEENPNIRPILNALWKFNVPEGVVSKALDDGLMDTLSRKGGRVANRNPSRKKSPKRRQKSPRRKTV